MTTSVTDLARFAMLQFRDGPAGGAQVLRGSTLREMHRLHWVEPDWVAGWGLGFRLMREGGRTLVGHGGRLRGYRTQLQLCPAERIGVIVMINAEDGEPLVVASRVVRVGGAGHRQGGGAAGQGWSAPWLGALRREVPEPRRRYPGAGARRRPGADRSLGAQSDARHHPAPAVAEHTFRMETTDGYASNGELVVFEMDSTGRVCRVKIGENYTEPIATVVTENPGQNPRSGGEGGTLRGFPSNKSRIAANENCHQLKPPTRTKTDGGSMPEVNLTAAFSSVPAGDAEAIKRLLVEVVEQIARDDGTFTRAKLVFTESDERCGLTAELDGVKKEGVPLPLDLDILEDAQTAAGARAQLKEAIRLYFRKVQGK